MLRQLTLKIKPLPPPGSAQKQDNRPEMALKGLRLDSESIAAMTKLDTATRELVQHSSKPDSSLKPYTQEFDASILLGPKPKTP